MNLDLSQFDTADYRRLRVQNSRPEWSWNTAAVAAMSANERAAWQQEFRAQFTFLLGDLGAWQRPALEAQVLETLQLDGYRRETVVFTTRPGLRAIAHLLIPDDVSTPHPAVICLPGHGRGARSMIGIAADGTQRPSGQPEEYDADYALQCVANGYVTLALETISFGDRRDEETRQRSADASTCGRDAMAALMLGETLPGWRVWDTMRAVDYLQTRAEIVDAGRIALMGISGGGLVALFAAAVDERIAATVVSCYFNTFADSVLSIDHCTDNYVPGLLKLCEMPDLAALVAPRAFFAEGGRTDPIFPVAATEAAIAQAQKIYQAFGVTGHFEGHIFDGGHQFHGVGAFEFLSQCL